jgi:acetyl-CoA synthetase
MQASSPPLANVVARYSAAQFAQLCQHAETDSTAFWGKVGERLQWIKPFTQVRDVSFLPEDFRIRWYADGELNVCVNCIDRHLPEKAQQTAIIFEPDTPGESQHISYQALYEQVCRMANVLLDCGVRKGDRVTIYLPMIPEAAVAMLACARIGAIHSVVFGGFSAESLAGRIADCQSKLVITADQGQRGGKSLALKAQVDLALQQPGTACVECVLVVRQRADALTMMPGRDHWLAPLLAAASPQCEPARMRAEDPLFILYTSGSTGKPKGVMHTSAGYLVYASYTHEMVFDLRAGDIYWCTADVGWVTGHSYVVYGPLANGGTTLMFEGVPHYPSFARFWQIIDKHQVSIFYTAPTAIRALMREGDHWVQQSQRSSLRLLGSVGEPINPEAWLWYHRVVGEARCPIVDTWWQTETGGILISPVPGVHTLKPGSASQALPGIRAEILDARGALTRGAAEGYLVLADSWPGQMRGVWGDPQRFIDTYFKTYRGYYFTGDGARRDVDGDFWITGRVDDVINVAGHRLGTAEIESALVHHPAVAEAAVVGFPHEIKGQGIYGFVTLKADVEASDALLLALKQHVRQQISAIATPDALQWAPGLPKTRSGKIMRRILRKIAANELDSLGDISTLADPAVVERLISGRIALP